MKPFQQKIVQEKAELDKKAAELSSFISGSPIFKSLAPDEQERLNLQSKIMHQYSLILAEHIAKF